jgi:glycosyltransferase involved in cell wall biosynthesis
MSSAVGSRQRKAVRILGTHGVPAAYGGFETAAENIARFLVRQGWDVTVYCQASDGDGIWEDEWEGMRRVFVPVDLPGWRGTSKFDWISIKHASQFRDEVCLTFGYNTAIFNIRQRALRIPNVINMDGIEWARKRWGLAKQTILYVNERIGAIVGNHLIADHPELQKHLETRAPRRKITTITYGADPVEDLDASVLDELSLQPGEYLTLIARPIPENSILDLVAGFSEKKRGKRLVVLGNYTPDSDSFHREVMDAASDEVDFVGPIYDARHVQSLRAHSLGYLHGHTVGGTNPSLVESLAAANPVIAHDNKYNRWVAGSSALYFQDRADVSRHLDTLLSDELVRASLAEAALARYLEEFTWEHVARQYEQLLLTYVDTGRS